MTQPMHRMRRLRRTPQLRRMVQETRLTLDDFIYPVFVDEGIDRPMAIETMPGLNRIPESGLAEEIRAIAADGVRAVMLFGISHHKDATGSDTLDPGGLMARMTRTAKAAVPEMIVITDNCFCEYTDHGHCGVVHDGDVDNDMTCENLGKQAVIAAQAGADMVAPSAMMDGQIEAMRSALDAAGFAHIPIMSYSSKFASAFYGPFRAAAGSELDGDRKAYQMDPMNRREARRESEIDEMEGADFLMVKPALPYLDVLRDLREMSDLPLVAYHVGGEYAMIKFAAQAGALDEMACVLESLGSIKRAGADIIITYFARDVARYLSKQ
ncbi:porphobilinogen synthase [Maritimibacter sp. DP1N21-5]|uniref:porphobilinogen synthase n=1 Tax=Maritimibacter sp. DP1N21-5 TaxID=2836867 RepID=UPI001C45E257|nr:porphobilinogen synthase [Maritimibacter sp. DP1N21-5]MBV7407380.1 porphobilinogen synthase [Maritimibacter sp. DP1N21-5]